jgi:molecular chaperone GrpE
MQDKDIDESLEDLKDEKSSNKYENLNEKVKSEEKSEDLLDQVDLLEEESYEKVAEERDALKDRLMRALADSENLRKRSERDRKDAEIYGGTKLARDLLSVYDNMSRALENIDDELRKKSPALAEGLELTLRELLAVFSKHKITQVMPEIGEKFDPKYHQAMFEAPVSDSVKGSIIQVMTNGFKIGDRLLRASQVGVSSNLNEPVQTKLDDEHISPLDDSK